MMGIFISPRGAAPTWWLFARTGTAGMTRALQGEGKGQESNSSRCHRKGKGFRPVCPMAPQTGVWSRGARHTPTTSFHFPGVSREGCSHVAPKLGDLFSPRWIAQCVLSQPCLFLLCTKSILHFCSWSLQESSSPKNLAIEANLPGMHDHSQVIVNELSA